MEFGEIVIVLYALALIAMMLDRIIWHQFMGRLIHPGLNQLPGLEAAMHRILVSLLGG
jgi:hypothetical protein